MVSCFPLYTQTQTYKLIIKTKISHEIDIYIEMVNSIFHLENVSIQDQKHRSLFVRRHHQEYKMGECTCFPSAYRWTIVWVIYVSIYLLENIIINWFEYRLTEIIIVVCIERWKLLICFYFLFCFVLLNWIEMLLYLCVYFQMQLHMFNQTKIFYLYMFFIILFVILIICYYFHFVYSNQ